VPETIEVIQYTEGDVREERVASIADIADLKDHDGVTWLNIEGLGSVEMIEELNNHLGLHPLALEDALNTHQRPKADEYRDHLYVVLRMLHHEDEVETEQVSVFLGRNFVVTLQEHPGDCLDSIRDRIRTKKGQIRSHGADYLMYAIVDAIIDSYFPFLEKLGEVLEELEDDVIAQPVPRTLGRVHAVKHDLLKARRATWPVREVISGILRDESPFIGETARIYLRDCYDHAVQVLDVVETYRELASGLMDVYMSSVSNRMNEVMKVLTIIATIFIPLTFIAGIYGMNFEWMPELKWKAGYPVVWVVMIAITVFMIVLFRRAGWLGGSEEE